MEPWVAKQWLIDCFRIPDSGRNKANAELAKKVILEALDKQERKKVTSGYHCPRCYAMPDGKNPRYCSHCGQSIAV